MMKVLVVGSGGREHALVAKIAGSPLVSEVLCAPGNPGTAGVEKARNLAPETVADQAGVVQVARAEKVGLVVVGPEVPLAEGLADALTEAGVRCFGPSKRAAQLEASKVWAKELMRRHAIPTGQFRVYKKLRPAQQALEDAPMPVVVKADGLAAGKGVVIAESAEAAALAVNRMLRGDAFGPAGHTVLIEEFLAGTEVSLLAITDGQAILPLPSAQDHKRIYDNDKGPNTGGMGAFSPSPRFERDQRLIDRVDAKILVPTVHALRGEGIDYCGVLYAGLILTKGGPRVLEFNVRFGDPETQAVLPRITSDLVPILLRTCDGTLNALPDEDALVVDPRVSVCVVLASGGYPGDYVKGLPIEGVDEAAAMEDVHVFHAGTARDAEGRLVTNGGRVLAVTALGETFAAARARAYEAAEKITFEDRHLRRDIAASVAAE